MELPTPDQLKELDKKKLCELKEFLLKYIHTIDVTIRDKQ